MDRSSLIDAVLYWSSSLTAEQKMLHYTACIDPLLSDFYWTYEFRKFAEGLLGESSNLVFLVGLQGVGKTSSLLALEGYMIGKASVYSLRWGEEDRIGWKANSDLKFLLIDLPDYAAGNRSAMRRDLDEIGELWYESKTSRRVIVVTVQKELFGGHYLFGKGDVFELRPLTVDELVGFYRKKFGSTYPFSEESLRLVARLSRGVFRRFLRYVKLCVEDMLHRGASGIGMGEVGGVVGPAVVGRDMALELSGFLRGYEREQAVAAMTTLLKRGEMNQKELAAGLGSTPSSLGRLLQKLELRGYVVRERGDRKELRVSIRD
jgi:hypothetical protein